MTLDFERKASEPGVWCWFQDSFVPVLRAQLRSVALP